MIKFDYFDTLKLDLRIWKFPLALNEYSNIWVPKNSQIMSVIGKNTHIFLYMFCDPNKDIELRSFVTIGTGGSIPVNVGTFIGTVTLISSWHVFETYRND